MTSCVSDRHPSTFKYKGGCICFPVTLCPLCVLLWFQLGTLHILEAMKEAGHDIRTLFLCGGLSKNSLFVQIHANATGIKYL